MAEINFKDLVEALKGKGPGDFIESATSGVLAGRKMSQEDKRAAFLEKVQQIQLDRQQNEDIYGAQKDLLGTQKDLAGGMQETVVTGLDGKVYRTPAKYSREEADQISASAADMFRRRTGLDPTTFKPMTDTGSKPVAGGGRAGGGDPRSLRALWESTKGTRDTLNNINQSWAKDKLNVGAKMLTIRTKGSSALRDYDSNKGAIAVAVYRAATGDNRLSDADAAARALPLLPQYGIDDPETIRRKETRIDYLTSNPAQPREFQEGEDSYDSFIREMNRISSASETPGNMAPQSAAPQAWKNYREKK